MKFHSDHDITPTSNMNVELNLLTVAEWPLCLGQNWEVVETIKRALRKSKFLPRPTPSKQTVKTIWCKHENAEFRWQIASARDRSSGDGIGAISSLLSHFAEPAERRRGR